MKHADIRRTGIVQAFVLLVGSAPYAAGQAPATAPAPPLTSAPTTAPATQVSRPPASPAPVKDLTFLRGWGAPACRKIGGARTEQEDLQVAALAPEEMSLTTQASPSLFWFLSRSTAHRVEFAITEEGEIEPALELVLDGSTAGIRRIDLRGHGLALKPGRDYEWVVAVVPEPEHRSRDIVAVGMIRRVDSTSALSDKLAAAADKVDRARVFAGFAYAYTYGNGQRGVQGIWYDAIAELSDAIDRESRRDRSDVSPARGARCALLRQVNLLQAAEMDCPSPTVGAPVTRRP